MSYDIDLTIDAGGPEPMYVEIGNVTSNLAPMWTAAGAPLRDWHGLLAGDCLPMLRYAVKTMEDDPKRFKLLDPPNGWGDYQACLGYLRRCVEKFAAYPKATIRVSR
jgi:hypothetical protein